jgi:exodeoxyribonuclease VII large subunit
VRRDLLILSGELQRRLLGAAARRVEELRVELHGLGRGLVDPKRLLEDMSQRLDDRAERLKNCWTGFLRERQSRVDRLRASLPHPRQLLAVKAEQLTGPVGRLESVRPRLLGERRRDLEGLNRVLESVSYKKVLQRGYAVVRGPEGAITRAEQVSAGLALDLEFANDEHAAAVGGDQPVVTQPQKPAAKPPVKQKPRSDDPQGSLL